MVEEFIAPTPPCVRTKDRLIGLRTGPPLLDSPLGFETIVPVLAKLETLRHRDLETRFGPFHSLFALPARRHLVELYARKKKSAYGAIDVCAGMRAGNCTRRHPTIPDL